MINNNKKTQHKQMEIKRITTRRKKQTKHKPNNNNHKINQLDNNNT